MWISRVSRQVGALALEVAADDAVTRNQDSERVAEPFAVPAVEDAAELVVHGVPELVAGDVAVRGVLRHPSPALKKFRVCSFGSKKALQTSSMLTWVGRPCSRSSFPFTMSATKAWALLTHLKLR